MTTQKDIEKKSLKATINHLKNIEKIRKGEMPNYGYLDICWCCGKKFTFWDRISFNIQHSFEGNSHRKECLGGIIFGLFF